ncbi:MAG: cytidine deaminase [Treponema sp.]|nr:cytidine deaminase [Treponema sp.]MEE3434227.1 cytidine deaminase [Treponema sp.]
MKKTQQEELLKKAKEMLAFSYTPYSNFKVGAALLSKSGKVFGGCNIESAAYGPSNCAERTAFFNAVSSGERNFEAIAIVGGPDGVIKDFCPPCGVCRQVMMEFCEPKKFKIILQNALGKIKEFTLEELLPLGFGPANLTE